MDSYLLKSFEPDGGVRVQAGLPFEDGCPIHSLMHYTVTGREASRQVSSITSKLIVELDVD